MTALINFVKSLNNTVNAESDLNYSKYSFDISFTSNLLEFLTNEDNEN